MFNCNSIFCLHVLTVHYTMCLVILPVQVLCFQAMYALMAKCEELSTTVKPVYQLADQMYPFSCYNGSFERKEHIYTIYPLNERAVQILWIFSNIFQVFKERKF